MRQPSTKEERHIMPIKTTPEQYQIFRERESTATTNQ